MTSPRSLELDLVKVFLDPLRQFSLIDSPRPALAERGLEFLVREGGFNTASLYLWENGDPQLRAVFSSDDSQKISGSSADLRRRNENLLRCYRSGIPLSRPPEHYLPVPGESELLGVLLLVTLAMDADHVGILADLEGVPELFSLGISFEKAFGRFHSAGEARFQEFLEAVPDAIFLTDLSGSVLKANAIGFDFLKTGALPSHRYAWPSLSVPSSFQFDGADRFSLLTENLGDSDVKKDDVRVVRLIESDAGDSQVLAMTRRSIGRKEGHSCEFLVNVRNVTQESLHAEIVERYRLLFERAQEGIVITDRNLTIIDINQSFTRVTGYTRGEVLGKTPSLLKSGRQKKSFYEGMWETLSQKGHWEGEIWDRKKSGEIYCEWLSISSIETDGTVSHYLGIFSDMTEHMKDKARILHLASHDVLTDLPNRRIFKERIEEACQRHQRTREMFAVGILDLDGFKSVNDLFGHQCGDALLVKVAERLLDVLCQTDTLSRLGGDEFGLLLTNLSETGLALEEFFSRIVESLRAPFDLGVDGGERIFISGSLGLTLCPTDVPRSDTLLSHADLALYQVKDLGKDRWFLFESRMSECLADQHRIYQEFDQALSRGEIVLHFQPQVGMVDGAILGAEALVRWSHPEKGILLPDFFIDIVEKTRLVIRLGRVVLDLALEQKKKWHEEGLDLRVSVNIGALHFLSGSFRQDIDDLLLRHFPEGDFPGGLMIEITEREVFRDISQAQKVAEFCLQRGIFLSLDDFGTGHASLTALQKLPVREIKIDRGFVQKIHHSEKDRAIVASLLATGRMMQIDVVAEGVETEKDGLSLIDMGCFWAQGYGIARPMAPEDFLGWIQGWSPFSSWRPKT